MFKNEFEKLNSFTRRHSQAHVYKRILAQTHYTHAPHCPSSTRSRLPVPSTRVALPAHASVLPPGAHRK